MPIDELFAEDYAAARIKFRTAAEAAGAALHAYEHPSQRGPTGEKLSIDVAVVGASAASRCLLLISGTHGVEGFAGSGCQVGFFRDSWYGALDRNTCAVVDIHTGLGPVAYGEPIVVGGSEGQNELAKVRFGAEVKTLTSGESASAILTGTLANAFDSWRADRDITFLGLEFGTKPVADVLAALRGDHWLHSAQNRDSPLRPKIKSAIRDAFYVDAPYWRAAVYGRTVDIVCRAARVLGAQ
jgi:hypothetical protein